MFGHLAGLFTHTGVEGWLTAAGLSVWDINLRACTFQNTYDRLAYLRIKRIDNTGDEEIYYFGHWLILYRW
jgi:hypothetical protein